MCFFLIRVSTSAFDIVFVGKQFSVCTLTGREQLCFPRERGIHKRNESNKTPLLIALTRKMSQLSFFATMITLTVMKLISFFKEVIQRSLLFNVFFSKKATLRKKQKLAAFKKDNCQ